MDTKKHQRSLNFGLPKLKFYRDDEMSLQDFRQAYVSRVLDLLDQNVEMAAGTLGLSTDTLRGLEDPE